MPWPKGKPYSPEHLAKRIASFKANKGRRKKTQINDGDVCFLCPGCKRYISRKGYYKDGKSPDGIKSHCKECHQKVSISTRDKENYLLLKRKSESLRRSRKKGTKSPRYTKRDLALLAEILGDLCLRCGSAVNIQTDHVIPISKGGIDHPVNFQPLCRKCNEKKQARDYDYRGVGQKKEVKKVWRIEFKRIEGL